MITHVKGTMILDYVRIIRSQQTKNWNKWLTQEDWAIVNGKILPSNWYPYNSFRNIAFAVFKEIANSNLQIAETFGKFAMKGMLAVYKNILSLGNPLASVKSLANLRVAFFKGDVSSEVRELGPKSLCYHVEVSPDEKDVERKMAFVHTISGNLLELVEQAGGKNVKSEIKPDGTTYNISVTWE